MKLLTLAVFLGFVTYVLCASPSPSSTKGHTCKSPCPSSFTILTPLKLTAGSTSRPSGGNTVSISSVWTVCLSVALFIYFSRH